MQTKNAARKIDLIYVTKGVQVPTVGERITCSEKCFSRMQWNKTCTKALFHFFSLSTMSQRLDLDTKSTFRKNAERLYITDS